LCCRWHELNLKMKPFRSLVAPPVPLAAEANVNALAARLMVEELTRVRAPCTAFHPHERLGLGLGLGFEANVNALAARLMVEELTRVRAPCSAFHPHERCSACDTRQQETRRVT
jgi:hypothetical protein